MSTATRKGARASGPHAADSHDVIRVHGADGGGLCRRLSGPPGVGQVFDELAHWLDRVFGRPPA